MGHGKHLTQGSDCPPGLTEGPLWLSCTCGCAKADAAGRPAWSRSCLLPARQKENQLQSPSVLELHYLLLFLCLVFLKRKKVKTGKQPLRMSLSCHSIGLGGEGVCVSALPRTLNQGCVPLNQQAGIDLLLGPGVKNQESKPWSLP